MEKYLLLLFSFLVNIGILLNAQEKPYSFGHHTLLNKSSIYKNKKLIKAVSKTLIDSVSQKEPERFGLSININYDLTNSGVWESLPDGSRLWRLVLESPYAKTINLLYDKFHLIEGAKLFIYNEDSTMILNTITSKNNHGTYTLPSSYATGLIRGDKIILELYEPSSIKQSIISISNLVYGYKCIPGIDKGCYSSSGSCQVNINCPEGSDWQNEKQGVVAIVLSDGRCWLTGSILNNTNHDGTFYCLTAHHGLDGSGGNPDIGDEVNWLFYWNWESPTCVNGSNFNPPYTTGARLISKKEDTDMAFFQLVETPFTFPDFKVWFNGWDRNQTQSSGGVMIHHPAGDMKKIATFNVQPTISGNFWNVSGFVQTSNGFSIPEGGSSGAPIFNSNHNIIGNHYTSSAANCTDPSIEFSNSGNLGISWNGTSSSDRLSDWLDPLGLNPTFLNGELFCTISQINNMAYNTPGSTIVEYCTISANNISVTNYCDLVFKVSKYALINDNFEVSLGSSFEVPVSQ